MGIQAIQPEMNQAVREWASVASWARDRENVPMPTPATDPDLLCDFPVEAASNLHASTASNMAPYAKAVQDLTELYRVTRAEFWLAAKLRI